MNQQKPKDEQLIGNEKIEEAIATLKKQPSDEALAVVLTQIRHRMQKKGQFVVSVEMGKTGGLQLQAKEIKGRGKWFVAFTTFEEQMKGEEKVMSTFMADIGQLFDMALLEEEIQGVVLNPWNLSLILDCQFIKVIKGQ